MVGANTKTKLSHKMRERNEESCEGNGRVVGIPVIVEPVVVPVPLAVVEVQVQHVPIAIRVPQKYTERLLLHCP